MKHTSDSSSVRFPTTSLQFDTRSSIWSWRHSSSWCRKKPPVNHWHKVRSQNHKSQHFFLPVQCLSSRCTICPGQSCSVSGAQGPTSHPELSGEEFSGLPPYSPWWAAHRSQWIFPHQLNIMTEYQFNHLFWHANSTAESITACSPFYMLFVSYKVIKHSWLLYVGQIP